MMIRKGKIKDLNIKIILEGYNRKLTEKLIEPINFIKLRKEYPEVGSLLDKKISELDKEYLTLFADGNINQDSTLLEVLLELRDGDYLSQGENNISKTSIYTKDGSDYPIGWVTYTEGPNNIIENIVMLAFEPLSLKNRELLSDMKVLFNDLIENYDEVNWYASADSTFNFRKRYDKIIEEYKGERELENDGKTYHYRVRKNEF